MQGVRKILLQYRRVNGLAILYCGCVMLDRLHVFESILFITYWSWPCQTPLFFKSFGLFIWYGIVAIWWERFDHMVLWLCDARQATCFLNCDSYKLLSLTMSDTILFIRFWESLCPKPLYLEGLISKLAQNHYICKLLRINVPKTVIFIRLCACMCPKPFYLHGFEPKCAKNYYIYKVLKVNVPKTIIFIGFWKSCAHNNYMYKVFAQRNVKHIINIMFLGDVGTSFRKKPLYL